MFIIRRHRKSKVMPCYSSCRWGNLKKSWWSECKNERKWRKLHFLFFRPQFFCLGIWLQQWFILLSDFNFVSDTECDSLLKIIFCWKIKLSRYRTFWGCFFLGVFLRLTCCGRHRGGGPDSCSRVQRIQRQKVVVAQPARAETNRNTAKSRQCTKNSTLSESESTMQTMSLWF